MTETEITDLKKNIKNVSTGSLQCRYNNKTIIWYTNPPGSMTGPLWVLSMMML